MPWTENDARIKSMPRAARGLWARVANAALKSAGDDGLALRMAWGAVRKAGYRKAGHKWAAPEMTKAEVEKMKHYPFSAAFALEKSFEKEGRTIIRGRISGLKVDRQGERMEKSALESMRRQLEKGDVKLLASHGEAFEAGHSVGSELQENGDLVADFEINKEHPYAPLMAKAAAEGSKKQFSVGGAVTDAVKVFDQGARSVVKSIKDVWLEHVAFTREGKAAYQDAALLGAMVKSVDWEDIPSPGGGEKRMTKQELLDKLKKDAAEFSEGLKKELAPKGEVTVDMLEKTAEGGYSLKKEHADRIAAETTLSKEDVDAVSQAVEAVLNAAGIETLEAEVEDVDKGEGDEKEEAEKSVKAMVEKTVGDAVSGLKKELDAAKGELAAMRKSAPAVGRDGKPLEKETTTGTVGAPAGDGGTAMEKALQAKEGLRKEVEGFAARIGELSPDERNEAKKKADMLHDLQADPVAGATKHGLMPKA
jgi:phage head maturation protease